MEVCHVSSVHSALDARIFHKECKTLLEAGHSVTLIAQADWDEKVMDGVRVVGLPHIASRYRRVELWRRIVGEVRARKPDVVHFHDPELLLIARWLRPAKLVYDCHEPYAETMLTKIWAPPWMRLPLSRLVALAEPVLARGVDAIVVTVDSHATRFADAGPPVVIIHNFPFAAGFDLASSADGQTIIHLGQQTELRGCSVIVEAMKILSAQMPEAKTYLVGAFDDSGYEASLSQRIAAYGLGQAVIRTGQVPYTDVPGWLARTNVGLIALQEAPHFMTSVPTKLFEYMISALPVVASDLPPARRFMEGLNCGVLVKAAEPHEYARALAYLLAHPAEARSMGRNGRAAIEERYNWAIEGPKLVELYRELERA